MSESDDSARYRFKGQRLTPAVIESLVLELFQGKLVERQVMVEEVLRAHLGRGGARPRAEDLPRSVKKALANMKDKGLAENPSYGYWRIAPATLETAGAPPVDETTDPEASQGAAAQGFDTTEAVADLVVGSGPGMVYLYYLPSYRLQAEGRGEGAWPCKIGRTERDPLTRILSQAATALPERPHVALVLRTAHPGAWESVLHGVLTLRGLRIESAPGSEWFLTSPDDVVALIRLLDPKAVGS